MINIVKEIHKVELKKKSLLNLEEAIIRSLDFSLRKVSSIQFLERFVTLFGLDG